MPDGAAFTRRSIEIICDLQDDTGGFLATTKEDAYPFVYPRDGSFMAMALNMHGHSDRSRKFYRLLSKVRRPKGEVLQRYNRGYPSVSQKGEADVTPIVIQGVYDTHLSSTSLDFLESSWGLVEEGVSYVLSCLDTKVGLVHTTRSVHETQGLEDGFEIWANSAAVRGLLDASRIAAAIGRRETSDLWRARAEELWGKVLERLFDPEKGMFIKNLRRDGSRVEAPDVSQLSPFYFGLCPDEATLERTLAHMRKTLWNKEVGGVNRFRDFEVVSDWHWYTGGTGASWPLFTLWMAKFYHRLGESGLEQECLDFVRRASTRDLEIPEKVAPRSGYIEWKDNETDYNERIINGVDRAEGTKIAIPGYLAWACPLGWSHAEYLMLGRRDESPELHKLLGEPPLLARRS